VVGARRDPQRRRHARPRLPALADGARAYLAKPIDVTELLALLDSTLKG
jgi:CheY-like chemotaxis protein